MGRIRNQHGPGVQPELCRQLPAPGGQAPGVNLGPETQDQ